MKQQMEGETMENIIRTGERSWCLRCVKEYEFDQAMKLIEQGRSFLKSQGIDQWQQGYPDEACIRRDIQAEKGYFLTDGTAIAGYLCLDFDGEPSYRGIKGQWLTEADAPYLVIHRLAFDSAFRGHGLTKAVFGLAEQLCMERQIFSIRVDTDGDNKIMQRVFQKIGFVYCGTIWFEGGDRLAYEKKLVYRA